MPKIPHYTKDQLDNALEEVNRGIPVRAAAKKYGVPRATLQFKLKNPNTKTEFGPEPYFHVKPTKSTRAENIKEKLIIKGSEQINLDTIENENPNVTSDKEKYLDLITLEDLGIQDNSYDCDPHQQTNSKTCIKDFLQFPPEPARKGKRNILRLPYHISGPEYQKILEDKSKEKEEIEKEKRKRKIERERKREDSKRKAKEIKTAKIKKKTKVSNQTCFNCSKHVKKVVLECSECHHVFHKSCVPKSHREHIPEDEGDKYLCKNCYNVTDDDERDEEVGDESDNDEFLSNLKDRQKEVGFDTIKFD